MSEFKPSRKYSCTACGLEIETQRLIWNGEKPYHADCKIAELQKALKALSEAIERSGFDMSPCRICGEAIICIPDGLPTCEACAEKEATE